MNEILFNGVVAKETLYEGYYATRDGEIVSVRCKGKRDVDYNNPRKLKARSDRDGYMEVCLSISENNSQKRIYRRVHRLVWEAFNGRIPNNLTIDHINSIPNDNRLENLQLLTREQNTSKARKGKEMWQKGKKHTARCIYKTFVGDKYIGNFDRKELIEKFNLTKYDVEQYLKPTPRKVQNNIRLEKV